MHGNQRFPTQVRLLAMFRGECSAVIAQLISKCLWSGWKWLYFIKIHEVSKVNIWLSAIILSNTINVLIFLFGLFSFYVFSGNMIKVNYFLSCLITLYSISSFLHYRLLFDPYAYVFIESIDYIIIFNFSIFMYFVLTCFICICFYGIDWLKVCTFY